MKVLICGNQIDELIQELNRYSGEHDNVVSYQQVLTESIWEMSQEKLSLFPIIIFVLETEGVIELAKQINKISPACQLIFAARDYGVLSQVYETKHAYFMLLENIGEELDRAMECALRNYDAEYSKNLLSLYCKGSRLFIRTDDIVFVEVMGRTLFIHTVHGDIYETNCSLKKFYDKLPSWFMRTHNSYVVNKKQVLVLEHPECVLRNGERIPVSRHYWQQVCEKME